VYPAYRPKTAGIRGDPTNGLSGRKWMDDDNWLISRFEGNPPGTVRRAAAGIGAQHSEEPCAACATGDVLTGV